MIDRQKLIIRCGGGSAVAEFLQRDGECWKTVAVGDAFIGRNGTGKTVEGDMKTPLGVFGVRRAFGIRPNPGTSLPYLRITDSIYACDREGQWYNTIVDTAVTGVPCGGEHMVEMRPEYYYGLELDYNADNVYPAGSAIFVHCKGVKPYTAGCVALDAGMMKRILKEADAGMRVEISDETQV